MTSPQTPGDWLDELVDQHVTSLAEINLKLDRVLSKLGGQPGPDPQPGGITLTASVIDSSRVQVDWTTSRNDIISWRIGRDGVDAEGHGEWFTDKAAADRSQSFNQLVPGRAYSFTLTAFTAAGALEIKSVEATPPGTTNPAPIPGSGDTAAARYGWGNPHPISDEFGYEGSPDPTKWKLPGAPGTGWPGHGGNGRRMPENSTVANGIMTVRGDANGNTGWVRQNLRTKYGRWEIRSRSRNTGSSGGLYHPLHLIWPTTEKWPLDGEYDWVEYADPDTKTLSAFLHYPHPSLPVEQESPKKPGVDMTQWHNLAFEWAPTGLTGYVDGEQWFHYAGGANSKRRNIQDMPEGYLTIQLDNFTGNGGLRPAVFEVEWVRFYPIP